MALNDWKFWRAENWRVDIPFEPPAVSRLTSAVRTAYDGAAVSPFFNKAIQDAYALLDDQNALEGERLRARSRDMAKNDPYVVRYLNVLKEKVIGPTGIRLRMGIRKPDFTSDTFANNLIEKHWYQYEKAVTVDGRNLREALEIFLGTSARDGECFAVIRRGSEFGPYRVQLQLLEADYLDLGYHAKVSNGNVVVSGVEYDQYFRRVAYHFFKERPRSLFNASTIRATKDRVRVAAEDVIHGFRREQASQTRGIPWLASSFETLHQIKNYKQTELFAARMGSIQQGFIALSKQDAGQSLPGIDDPVDQNKTIYDAMPGQFPMLPPGATLLSWNPQHPHNNFGTFLKENLRAVAASVGLSYNTLANDAESTSYSSLRQHTIDERGTYKELQQWLIDTLLNRLFEAWLRFNLDMGTFRFSSRDGVESTLSRGFDAYNCPHWRCQTWPWLDPVKDATSTKIQLDYKLKSRTDVVREMGRDIFDVIDEIAQEEQYAAAKGVDLSIPALLSGADAVALAEAEKEPTELELDPGATDGTSENV